MIVKKSIDLTSPLTQEEEAMLKAAAERSIEFDEDSPELTEEDLKKFKRVSSHG